MPVDKSLEVTFACAAPERIPAPHVADGTWQYQLPSGEWVTVEIENQEMYRMRRCVDVGVPMADCPGSLRGPLRFPT